MRRPLSATLGVAALLTAMPAVAGEFVVVDSLSAPYTAGQVIASSDGFVLPAGAVVTVIGETGAVTKLNGPLSGTLETLAGTEPASAGGPGVVGTISRLLQSGTPPHGKSLLTVRSVAVPGMRPQVDADAIMSMVDFLTPGTYCIPESGAPKLSRERAADYKTVRLTEAETGKVAIVEFPSQVATVLWPPSLPIADGALYTAQAYDTGEIDEFTLYRVPANLPNDAHRVAFMVDRGCLEQARLLLAHLTASASGS